MALDRDEVLNIAKLSRIELTEGEIEMFAGQLGAILEYIEQLKGVDTTSVEPMLFAASEGNVFREDILRESIPVDQALLNAPSSDQNMFEVPQVIDEGSA